MRWAVLVAPLVAMGAALPASGDESAPTCGTKRVYGHKLRIRVDGRAVPCSRVREIIRGRCVERKTWSCFSLQAPDPLLIWFREKERFRAHYSTTIVALRYPCSEARVTHRAWRRAHQGSWAFPTREQVMADDLIRCKQLVGKSGKEVVRLLGPADAKSHERGRTYLDYEIGLERDSFFQVDSEFLSIEIGRNGVFRSAGIYQG